MPLKLVKIKGSENWYIRGTLKGQRVFSTTGTPRDEIAEAERIRTENEILNASVFGVRKTITFGEAVVRYRKSGGRGRYLGEYDEDTGEWTGVLKYFVDTHLTDIGQAELDDAALKAYPDAKPQTRNRNFYAPFITVWNFAAQEEFCQYRKWRRPRVRKSDKKKTKWFTCEDAARFFDACSPHLRALFLLCIYTGSRITEAVELDIKDINLEKQWVVFNATKTDAYRGVPLHPAVVWGVKQYLGARTSGRLFLTQRNQPYESKRDEDGLVGGGGYFKTAWEGAQRRAKLEGFTPYGMRHTLNNWLIMAGVEPTTRESIMGHQSDSTNAIYSDVPDSHLIKIVSALPDFTDFSHKKKQNLCLFSQNSTKKDKKNKLGKQKKSYKTKGKDGAVDQD